MNCDASSCSAVFDPRSGARVTDACAAACPRKRWPDQLCALHRLYCTVRDVHAWLSAGIKGVSFKQVCALAVPVRVEDAWGPTGPQTAEDEGSINQYLSFSLSLSPCVCVCVCVSTGWSVLHAFFPEARHCTASTGEPVGSAVQAQPPA